VARISRAFFIGWLLQSWDAVWGSTQLMVSMGDATAPGMRNLTKSGD